MKALGRILLIGSCLLALTSTVWSDENRDVGAFKSWLNRDTRSSASSTLRVRDAVAVDPVGGLYGPYPNVKATYTTFSGFGLIPNPAKDAWVKADSTRNEFAGGLKVSIPWPGETQKWHIIPESIHSLDKIQSKIYVPEKTSIVHSGAASTILAADLWRKGPETLPKYVTGFSVSQTAATARYGAGNAIATGSNNRLRDIGKYAANGFGMPIGAGSLKVSSPSSYGLGSIGSSFKSYNSSTSFKSSGTSSFNNLGTTRSYSPYPSGTSYYRKIERINSNSTRLTYYPK